MSYSQIVDLDMRQTSLYSIVFKNQQTLLSTFSKIRTSKQGCFDIKKLKAPIK